MDTSGILDQGGTILGTSNRDDPFRVPRVDGDSIRYEDHSAAVLETIRQWKIDALICAGGDGSLGIAHRLHELGLPVVGVPKTIDNDLAATDRTFGIDSAVAVVTRSLDRLHSTAESHHRVMIVETMGRWAGWLALAGGAAGGADVILIPEIPYHPSRIAETLVKRERLGKRFTILTVAEGAAPAGGEATVSEVDPLRPEAIRLGGVGFRIAEQLEGLHGQESRVVVLGHLQRAGPPVASDRNLATLFGIKAVELALQGGRGRMAALHGSEVVDVALADAVAAPRRVPLDHSLVTAARAVGTDFGD